jgi:hypothetical protein
MGTALLVEMTAVARAAVVQARDPLVVHTRTLPLRPGRWAICSLAYCIPDWRWMLERCHNYRP